MYVTINHDGFHNPETMRRNLETMERYFDEIEQESVNTGTALDEQAPRHRAALMRQISEARAILRREKK